MQADGDDTVPANDAGEPGPAQLDAVLQALNEAVTTLEGVASGYKVGADNGIRLVEGTTGPRHKDSCRDHHPQCGNWAKWVRIFMRGPVGIVDAAKSSPKSDTEALHTGL